VTAGQPIATEPLPAVAVTPVGATGTVGDESPLPPPPQPEMRSTRNIAANAKDTRLLFIAPSSFFFKKMLEIPVPTQMNLRRSYRIIYIKPLLFILNLPTFSQWNDIPLLSDGYPLPIHQDAP
jgi:hypothetical protein